MSVILLAGQDYYPAGWKDFRGKFDTVEAAKARLAPGAEYDQWYQIVDYEALELIEKGSYRRQWTPCVRCRGTGKAKTHTHEMTHQGLRVVPVMVMCSACRGNRGTYGPYGWHKDET